MIFSTNPWVWVAAILTLCIFSFLYKENPFYRFAEHLFVGISAGYGVAVYWNNAIVPNLFVPLFQQHNWWFIIPGLLGMMFFFRFNQKTGWLILIPMAVLLGTGSGMSLTQSIQTYILKQMQSALADATNVIPGSNVGLVLITLVLFIGLLAAVVFYVKQRSQMSVVAKITYAIGIVALAAFCGKLAIGLQKTNSLSLIWGIVTLFGVISTLSYFFFSREQKGLLRVSANIGVWFIMIGFGASFGNTVMGRISLLIGRVQFLLTDWIHIIK